MEKLINKALKIIFVGLYAYDLLFCIIIAFACRALNHVACSSYTALCALGQVHMEPESKVQAEQAQVEAITILALDQGKPQCI
jgi:hypothetical protein